VRGAPYWMGAVIFVLAAVMLLRPSSEKSVEKVPQELA